jgi:hypothetical protein
MFKNLPKLEKLLLITILILAIYGIGFHTKVRVNVNVKPTDVSSAIEKSRYEWPRVFTNPNFSYEAEYPDEGRRKFAAIADCLNG